MDLEEAGKWFREERAKMRGLSDQLRKLIAVTPRTGVEAWLKQLADHFERFRAHCCQHMAYEEKGGYLEPVLNHRPTLSNKVEQLKSDHQEILRLMTDINEQIARLKPGNHILIDECRDRIRRFLEFADEHDRHENMLVSYAFSQDIGTSD
jgi:hemerythrin-like domain-containing protein